MASLKVTQLEKQVLESLASEMYAELGFSDVGYPELRSSTGLTNNTLRGVIGSLVKKEMVDVDIREDEMDVNSKDVDMHIIYLTSKTQGLVEHWVEDEDIQPVKLIVE